MDATDDLIKSAVESEISRMLARNANPKPVEKIKIKQEPVDHMEPAQNAQESDQDMDTSHEENEVDLTPKTGSNKFSVKVVTKYMCRYCARQFDSPDEMQEHIASHARGKSSYHSCYVCGKIYSTPSKLQRHVRVHSGERPYACNICGRRFTRSDHVKQHLKVHMPQKQRNTCRLCGQKFLRRQTLHSHLQQSHGVSTVYTCHRCGEAFDEITKLHSHKNMHVSIYGKNDGPEVEGGMVIKQEPGQFAENDLPMIGLAKFSLGPQPAPEELLKVINNAHNNNGDSSENGYSFKIDNYASETHRIAVAVQKPQKSQADMKPTIATTTYNYNTYEEETQTSTKSFENQEDSFEEDMNTNTVSDGMNMFILPSDIKKERESPDHTMNDGTDEPERSEDCQTYIDNANAEDDDQDDEPPVEKTEDEKIVEKVVQNLLTGPPSQHKGVKMKLFGPASYKAAMRNKIAMKVPTPQLRQLKKPTSATASAVGTSTTETTYISKPPKANNFSPYIIGSTAVSPKTESPVQVTLSKENERKLSKCEHCCIWFEDYTMCLLHNSLHSADENDPFTCRKCMKKLGNRLEFTAHLVWHLEPNMK